MVGTTLKPLGGELPYVYIWRNIPNRTLGGNLCVKRLVHIACCLVVRDIGSGGARDCTTTKYGTLVHIRVICNVYHFALGIHVYGFPARVVLAVG